MDVVVGMDLIPGISTTVYFQATISNSVTREFRTRAIINFETPKQLIYTEEEQVRLIIWVKVLFIQLQSWK